MRNSFVFRTQTTPYWGGEIGNESAISDFNDKMNDKMYSFAFNISKPDKLELI